MNNKRLQAVPESLRSHLLLTSRLKGACLSLKGNVLLSVLLIDDGESKWNFQAVEECKYTCQKQMEDLSKEALRYGAKLDIVVKYYHCQTASIMDWGSSDTCVKEALKNACLPPFSTFCVDTCMQAKVDEAPLIAIVNKHGRSFAIPSEKSKATEYAVLYRGDGVYSFIHELCHLFGAKDYYYPSKLKQVALRMFGHNNMLNDKLVKVDVLSAYLIGWCDTLDEKAIAFLKETADITTKDFNEGYKESVFSGYVERTLDSGFYQGYVLKGVIHGQGKLQWNNGSSYEGEWQNGQRHGHGIMKWDTCTYEGMWEHDQFHGIGSISWNNGTSYEGNFVNGKRQGYGILKWARGDVYTGFFEDDMMHGKGIMIYYNGRKVEGEWNKGKLIRKNINK